MLVASSDGRGFVATGEAVLAETRKGKQLMNLRPKARMTVVKPVAAGSDSVAVIGEEVASLYFPGVDALGRERTLRLMAPHVTHFGVHDHGFNNVSTYGNLWRLIGEGRIPDAVLAKARKVCDSEGNEAVKPVLYECHGGGVCVQFFCVPPRSATCGPGTA